MELWFHHRLQICLGHGLRDAVTHRRNAQLPRAACTLRDLDLPHRWRKVAAGRHPIPDLVQVALQILLECRHRLPIHTRGTAVRSYPPIRLPNYFLGNLLRLCFTHGLLPLPVDPQPQPDDSAPLLCSHYRASTLLRTDPPLCPASVLYASWVIHLALSLRIGATGSHVPHKSQNQARAAFMPDAVWTVNRFPPNLSQGNDGTLVSTTFLRFRHFISGSLSFAFLVHT